MDREKVHAHHLIETAAWGGIGLATLAAAYELSALIAHWGTFIHWR